MLIKSESDGEERSVMITVSVCLIVKNEEVVLARCLDSLKEIADEIIVVDTGSTDRTKQIASEYTGQVYDFVWKDDFSAARNFSFSKANMEYIYVADADEIIDDVNQKHFLALKQVLLPEIEIVQMYYTNQMKYNTTYNFDRELRPKLYKRLREFVWIDPLHESVRQEPLIYDSDIEIIHMPMSGHATRDFATFQKAIATQGMLSLKLRGMYARELYIAGEDKDFLDAEKFFLSLVNNTECKEDELRYTHCVLARAARIRGDSEAFHKSVIKLLAMGEPPSEACYELGIYYMERKEEEEAVIWFYNAAYETKPDLNLKYGEEYPIRMLAVCNRNMGNEEMARSYEDIIK